MREQFTGQVPIKWICALILLMGWSAPAFSQTHDETLLLDQVRAIAATPVDDFTVLGEMSAVRDGHYRYQLAFLSYGLCSVVLAHPALRPEARRLFVRLLEKMEHPTTLAYWRALGYPADRMNQDNAMFRGHLNLMYALAHDRFGETRFDERFHALSRTLFDNVTAQHPVCCEPDQLFIQCNSVIVLSLFLHDRAFGTAYAKAGQQLLDWAHEHMSLEGTALLRDDYRPSTGGSSAARAGYANAWTIAFLSGVPELRPDTQKMYADWRRTFVDPVAAARTNAMAQKRKMRPDEMLASAVPLLTLGFCAYARGAPVGEKLSAREALAASLMATTFGALAARSQHDEALRRRLERTVAFADMFVAAYEKWLPAEYQTQVRTFHSVALLARTFRGWDQVLRN